MRGHALIAEFARTPWAMEPTQIAAWAGVLARWQAQGASLGPGVRQAMEDDDGYTDRRNAFEVRRAAAQQMSTTGSIAVLPLYGALVQRAGMATEYCGGTSTQQFTQAFRQAMQDPGVGGVLIDGDGPGGSVYGVGELAAEILEARSRKPVFGFVNSLAASAHYWVMSACTELWCTPGGEVGSIGVWQAHEYIGKALEEAGVVVSLISEGRYKTEGNQFEPLGDEARQFMQSRVGDYYGAFTKGVSKGRGAALADVRDKMGQGRVLGADAALAANMIDGIDTFDGVVRRLQRAMKSTGSPAVSQAQAAMSAARMRLAAA